MSDIFSKLGVIIASIVVLLIIGPLLSIWAWNTLFGSLHIIPYTFETWAAAMLFFGVVKFKGSK